MNSKDHFVQLSSSIEDVLTRINFTCTLPLPYIFTTPELIAMSNHPKIMRCTSMNFWVWELDRNWVRFYRSILRLRLIRLLLLKQTRTGELGCDRVRVAADNCLH